MTWYPLSSFANGVSERRLHLEIVGANPCPMAQFKGCGLDGAGEPPHKDPLVPAVCVETVSAPTGQEKTDLDAAVAAHDGRVPASYKPNFEVQTPLNGQPNKVERWETDNGDGTYSGLAERDTYTYDKKKLVSALYEKLWSDGTVRVAHTESLFSDGDKTIKKVT